jgi:hypothetical protein
MKLFFQRSMHEKRTKTPDNFLVTVYRNWLKFTQIEGLERSY